MAPPDADARELIAADLGMLIDEAIGSFRRMAGVPVPLEPKGFAAYLRATNALLDHIDGLVRLKDWTDGSPPSPRGRTATMPAAHEGPDPAALVAAAREALGTETSSKKGPDAR